MNTKFKININYALLALQSALLEAITSELRAVSIDFDEEKKIFYINFYYHGKVSENIIDLWQCSTTEASADLGPDYFTKYEIIKLEYPNHIPDKGILIYYRKEPEILANIQKTFKLIKCKYSKEHFSAHLRCAMQKAILGYITPNIRKISIEWWEKLIYVHFYYQGSIKEEDKENMYQICKRLFDEFPNCCIRLLYFSIDEPIPLPQHKELIYLRYEKNYGLEPLFQPQSK